MYLKNSFFQNNRWRKRTNRMAVNLLKLVALLLSVMVCYFSCNGERQTLNEIELNVVSYGGGAYQQSHISSFCEPYSEITGVNISPIVWNAEYGKLKTMVASGNTSWDVVEVTAAQFSRGLKDNLFEKLTITPRPEDFIEGTVSEYGVANVYWGTVLAYNNEFFKNEKPQSWFDFWDVNKFPGDRALYDDPRGNLEFALLASGVAVDSLYPLDVDKAFKKLDEIKPFIKVWWTDGSQALQILMTGTAIMSSAWNGRIFASDQAKELIGYTWNGGALELDYWIIPKGSKNPDVASRFIYFASLPYPMAKQAEIVGYGPVNLESLDYVKNETRTQLPTYPDNWKISFVVNANWWSDNEETIKTRWINWKNQ